MHLRNCSNAHKSKKDYSIRNKHLADIKLPNSLWLNQRQCKDKNESDDKDDKGHKQHFNLLHKPQSYVEQQCANKEEYIRIKKRISSKQRRKEQLQKISLLDHIGSQAPIASQDHR